MAFLTKAQAENLLDTIAAQYEAARGGLLDGAQTPEHGDLFSQIDAVGDPELKLALMRPLRDHDQALRDPKTAATLLAPHFGPLLQQLQQQIKQEAAFSPATLDNALSVLGVQVSPLLQEIAGHHQSLGVPFSAANVWAPPMEAQSADILLAGTEGALADVTYSDFPAWAQNGDVVYIGFDTKPTGRPGVWGHLAIALSTVASADLGLGFDYWDGTAWVPLSHTDGEVGGPYAYQGTGGGTRSGVVAFILPPSWARTNRDPDGKYLLPSDKTPRFYLRIERTAAEVASTPVLKNVSTGTGLGLVMIDAEGQATFVAGQRVDTTRYDVPNQLQLRPLTPMKESVTATITYTRRDGTPERIAPQKAWKTDKEALFPANGTYLTLQEPDEGVQAVTGVSIVTKATSGAFIIESVPPRDATK